MSASDVAVIGAGPTGAWTSYLLARRGARVLLIDPSHPREKACGGGVTGRALSLVAAAIGSDLAAVTIDRARFLDSSTNRSATVRLSSNGSNGPLVVASRRVFDGLLLSAARREGAEFIASRVNAIERDGPSWRVTRQRDRA